MKTPAREKVVDFRTLELEGEASVTAAAAGTMDERPSRVHLAPSHGGAELTSGVMDCLRERMLGCLCLSDLLRPRSSGTS